MDLITVRPTPKLSKRLKWWVKWKVELLRRKLTENYEIVIEGHNEFGITTDKDWVIRFKKFYAQLTKTEYKQKYRKSLRIILKKVYPTLFNAKDIDVVPMGPPLGLAYTMRTFNDKNQFVR